MIGFGFKKLHKLYGNGDCALLVCYCIKLLIQHKLKWKDIEPTFGYKNVDVLMERRALLQYLYDSYDTIPELHQNLLFEAKMAFPDCRNETQMIQKYILKMAENNQYLGISEMAAGAYQDKYTLVIIRKTNDAIEIAGLVSPPSSSEVFYCLISNNNHFDLLEPFSNVLYDKNGSLFPSAPLLIKERHNALVFEEKITPAKLGDLLYFEESEPTPPMYEDQRLENKSNIFNATRNSLDRNITNLLSIDHISRNFSETSKNYRLESYKQQNSYLYYSEDYPENSPISKFPLPTISTSFYANHNENSSETLRMDLNRNQPTNPFL